MRWLVPNREASVVVRHVFVAIVPTLSEPLLEAIALVDQDRLEVA